MSTQTTHAPPSEVSHHFGGPVTAMGLIRENLHELRASWGWFVALGILLIIVGTAAMSCSATASLATALVFGSIMLVAGACYLVGAFFTRSWGGFFLSLLAAILHVAVGLILIDRPGEALLIYTLLLAAFFFVEGLVRIIGALFGRFHSWGWALFSGIVTLALGVMIWRQWPLDGIYVVGLFVGVNLVVSGAMYVLMGLRIRRLPA